MPARGGGKKSSDGVWLRWNPDAGRAGADIRLLHTSDFRQATRTSERRVGLVETPLAQPVVAEALFLARVEVEAALWVFGCSLGLEWISLPPLARQA